MIELVSHFLSGFVVVGLGPAILTSVVVAVTSWLMSSFIGPQGRIEAVTVRHYERY
jgi:uncharacterized membrane protein YvlD (DUF360 family)